MRHGLPVRQGWRLPPGALNTICDVPGVAVGHASIHIGGICTGVTAVLPHAGNLYERPVPAGASVLNGFGKSVGLVQLQELGDIETPILLTNTFSVPVCSSALIRQAVARNPEAGRSRATVNPLVLECNDGQVNDIQAMAVTEQTAFEAMEAAGTSFQQGTVGAGSGMRTFGFAGGVGSASRSVVLAGGSIHTLGVLVLSNFGQQRDLRVFGRLLADADFGTEREAPNSASPTSAQEKGSIIVIMASDAPLDSRQLTRLSRRSGAALGRLGSYYGHGSGDIALAFSTANVCQRGSQDAYPAQRLCESRMDPFFESAVEATEEAVLNAIWHGQPHVGYDGSILPAFRHTLKQVGLAS